MFLCGSWTYRYWNITIVSVRVLVRCNAFVTVVTKVVEVPEEKTPDETVAQPDEEHCENPRAVAYVQKHAYNSQRAVCAVLLTRSVFSAIPTSASGFICHFRIGFFRLQISQQLHNGTAVEYSVQYSGYSMAMEAWNWGCLSKIKCEENGMLLNLLFFYIFCN